MPFNARVFQIFIASPGDVHEEREIATDVIQRWNDLNARERSLVLLPLRWETHSSPELGSRPQAVINRQVLDQSDLVVGIFWTRLGTPTGVSASGTVEEIERTGNAGKPIMLYFSNAMVDIDKVDLDEYKRLKDFKTKTYPEGLIESYSSLGQFRDKFSRQLSMKVRDLVAHDRKDITDNSSAGKSDISVVVVRSSAGRVNAIPLQIQRTIKVEHIICVNPNEIPDFGPDDVSEIEQPDDDVSKIEQPDDAVEDWGTVLFSRNKNYLREWISYYIESRKYSPCRVAVVNNNMIGVSNVALEMKLSNPKGTLALAESLPQTPEKYRSGIVTTQHYFNADAVLEITERENEWELLMDISVVQAKRTVISRNEFFLGATLSSSADLEITVYSTTLAPLVIHNSIEIEVSQRNMTYQEILDELGDRVETD